MSKINWIKRFTPITSERLIEKTLETEGWISGYVHEEGDTKVWEVLPGKEQEEGGLLLKPSGLYGGAAGIALFYLRLYKATGDEKFLDNAKGGINYCISQYRGEADYKTDAVFLKGAKIGLLNGPAGGAFVSSRLYEVTGDENYRDFAISCYCQ